MVSFFRKSFSIRPKSTIKRRERITPSREIMLKLYVIFCSQHVQSKRNSIVLFCPTHESLNKRTTLMFWLEIAGLSSIKWVSAQEIKFAPLPLVLNPSIKYHISFLLSRVMYKYTKKKIATAVESSGLTYSCLWKRLILHKVKKKQLIQSHNALCFEKIFARIL